MTVWATSSPFSPLAPRSQQAVEESDFLPDSKPAMINDPFEVSESILPSRAVEAVSYEDQHAAPAEVDNDLSAHADEATPMEQMHAQQQDDRLAWRIFLRQDPLLMTKPIPRLVELSARQDLVNVSSELPEVHFAAAKPQPLREPISDQKMALNPELPDRISRKLDQNSIAVQKPNCPATLPVRLPYITAFGRKTTSVPDMVPALPRRNSWETGRY